MLNIYVIWRYNKPNNLILSVFYLLQDLTYITGLL